MIVETAADHESSDISDVGADLPSTAFEDVKGQLLFDDAIEVSAGVSDGMSGIRSVEWMIDAPHDEEASDIGVIEIDNDGNASGEEEDVALWQVDEDSKDRNLITNVSAVLPIDADSNDITLTLKLTDRAGHKTIVEKVFSVDRYGSCPLKSHTTTIPTMRSSPMRRNITKPTGRL